MDIMVSNVQFEGRKNPKLHLRRKQLKNLRRQEAELSEKCKLLQANCDSLEIPLKKVTPLPYDNPKTPTVTKLWRLNFDTQYNFMYGSYADYKKSKQKYAKEAVKNLDLLKYVNQPIKVEKPISLFSKVGLNIVKNSFLDFFRIKTPEEKQFSAYAKEVRKRNTMHKTLGI